MLVVDGDPGSRAALSSALHRAGYQAEQVGTGEEALKAAGRQRPAIVIMETHLPGASGYEICREFRERHGDALPIIFVSAARTEETDRVAGLLLGADEYLAKPVHFDHLLARVRRLMAQSGAVAQSMPWPLTLREQQVLDLLAAGLVPDEIARRLVVTPKTVAKHMSTSSTSSASSASTAAHRPSRSRCGAAATARTNEPSDTSYPTSNVLAEHCGASHPLTKRAGT